MKGKSIKNHSFYAGVGLFLIFLITIPLLSISESEANKYKKWKKWYNNPKIIYAPLKNETISRMTNSEIIKKYQGYYRIKEKSGIRYYVPTLYADYKDYFFTRQWKTLEKSKRERLWKYRLKRSNDIKKMVGQMLKDMETKYPELLSGGSKGKSIFFDGFESYGKQWDVRKGLPVAPRGFLSNYTWTITKGSIDVDPRCGNGSSGVDLDGTYGKKRKEGKAGKMVSKSINLSPGTYQLKFDVSGNPIQTNENNTMDYGITGGLVNGTISKGNQDSWQEIKRQFSISSPRSVQIFFDHKGGDWDGLYLDNVEIVRIR